jgi:hypothetical protein
VTGPSLTGWLVQALSRQQGFGPNGIKMNYAQPAFSWALMKTRAIDGGRPEGTYRAQQVVGRA